METHLMVEKQSRWSGEVSSLHRLRGWRDWVGSAHGGYGRAAFSPFPAVLGWNPGLCRCQARFLTALFFFEMGSHYLAQSGLQLLGSTDPSASARWTEEQLPWCTCSKAGFGVGLASVAQRLPGVQGSGCLPQQCNKHNQGSALGSTHTGQGAWAGVGGLWMEEDCFLSLGASCCLLAPELLNCHF